jgi:hypothetical protein
MKVLDSRFLDLSITSAINRPMSWADRDREPGFGSRLSRAGRARTVVMPRRAAARASEALEAEHTCSAGRKRNLIDRGGWQTCVGGPSFVVHRPCTLTR